MYNLYKFVSAFLLLLLPVIANAQDKLLPVLVGATDDKVFLHSGQTIVGKILSVDDREVSFVYLKMENVKCGRHAVAKVEYASGKTEVISNKIVIASKDDWEKVMILTPKDDISGLKYQKSIGDFRNPVTPDMLSSDKEAVKKLKQAAAAEGFPFVQVTAKKNIAYTYN